MQIEEAANIRHIEENFLVIAPQSMKSLITFDIRQLDVRPYEQQSLSQSEFLQLITAYFLVNVG